MLRAKIDASGDFVENSYNSPDSVNSIKWDTLEDETYQNVYHYYKGLIAFRKAHAALRLTNADDVNANITSVDGLCLLYTSPSPRDGLLSRMPSSA